MLAGKKMKKFVLNSPAVPATEKKLIIHHTYTINRSFDVAWHCCCTGLLRFGIQGLIVGIEADAINQVSDPAAPTASEDQLALVYDFPVSAGPVSPSSRHDIFVPQRRERLDSVLVSEKRLRIRQTCQVEYFDHAVIRR